MRSVCWIRSKQRGRLAELSGIEESRELSEALEQAEQLLFRLVWIEIACVTILLQLLLPDRNPSARKFILIKNNYNGMDRKIDRILLPKLGIPDAGLIKFGILITIQGANYPSQALTAGFTYLGLLGQILIVPWMSRVVVWAYSWFVSFSDLGYICNAAAHGHLFPLFTFWRIWDTCLALPLTLTSILSLRPWQAGLDYVWDLDAMLLEIAC